jgi:hypothetical protein
MADNPDDPNEPDDLDDMPEGADPDQASGDPEASDDGPDDDSDDDSDDAESSDDDDDSDDAEASDDDGDDSNDAESSDDDGDDSNEAEASDDGDDSDDAEASDDDGDDSDDAEASDDDGDDSDDAEASDDDGDDSDDSDDAEASDDEDDDSDDAEASDDEDDGSDDAEASDDDTDDGAASGQEITKTDLDQGTDLPTGDQHDLVIPYEDVDIEIEWPSYIAERLPDDFALTLSADDMDDQTVTASGAEWTEDGAVRFAFGWRKKTRAVTLKATSGDQAVTLWDEQVAGDLSMMIDWDSWLDPLLIPEQEIQAPNDGPTGASSTPPDLNWDEMRALLGDDDVA